MLKKVEYCKMWGVQISDCRYRPLTITHDNYRPLFNALQPDESYYIHKKGGWSNEQVKQFRRNVRIHNIWVRYAKDKGHEYDKRMEKWSAVNNMYKYFGFNNTPQIDEIEKSVYLQKKISILNKIRKHCKDVKITPPSLTGKSSLPELQSYVSNLAVSAQVGSDEYKDSPVAIKY